MDHPLGALELRMRLERRCTRGVAARLAKAPPQPGSKPLAVDRPGFSVAVDIGISVCDARGVWAPGPTDDLLAYERRPSELPACREGISKRWPQTKGRICVSTVSIVCGQCAILPRFLPLNCY